MTVAMAHLPRIHPERQARNVVASNVTHRAVKIDSHLRLTHSGGDHGRMLADAILPLKTAFEDAHAPVMSSPEYRSSSASTLPSGERIGVTYVASNLPSHGAYAADDESDSNMTVADVSRSVRRQQELFSYTNR